MLTRETASGFARGCVFRGASCDCDLRIGVGTDCSCALQGGAATSQHGRGRSREGGPGSSCTGEATGEGGASVAAEMEQQGASAEDAIALYRSSSKASGNNSDKRLGGARDDGPGSL